MNISPINHRFTPISLPESPTLIGSQTAIPMERITTENVSSVQDGVRSESMGVDALNYAFASGTDWHVGRRPAHANDHAWRTAIIPNLCHFTIHQGVPHFAYTGRFPPAGGAH